MKVHQKPRSPINEPIIIRMASCDGDTPEACPEFIGVASESQKIVERLLVSIQEDVQCYELRDERT